MISDEIHGKIFLEATLNGCSPVWHDGIFGWAWHCDCEDEAHFMDSQCSAISVASARRQSKRRKVIQFECGAHGLYTSVQGSWCPTCEVTYKVWKGERQ